MREIAVEERTELGLSPRDPFDPYQLCDQHGISVYSLAELHEMCPEAVDHFTQVRASAWSAALIPLGSVRLIVENHAHAIVRRRSSIAHELGHHLLEHRFSGVILGDNHSLVFSAEQEKQADFLAGELLIPLKAAERMAFDGWDNNRVASAYNVSTQFAQNQMKGQRVRAARASQKFRH
ncbi:ImmA/IrrE family metallo-endopeptidase [Leifsonia sp. PS1209]|uniref:ImmA/IrrE family metallo-endopeptidase n=1 Tax=Leifsonia sp. PS1209 TaxID=2724914 RepID=UPI001442C1A5|nr:ImmA/IrrE family metallo-endopeptidase [Leifsonia sp. PS1209]QIZ99812.1 ImmA/IrrE family metallo-endopeptidase [Leifsonia sp. PS1209]